MEHPLAGCSKRPVFSPAQPRRAKTRRSAGKATASEEARRTLRYVEPLSEARTLLADFFSVLLEERYDFALQRQTKHQRLALSEVYVQFTPDPKLAG